MSGKCGFLCSSDGLVVGFEGHLECCVVAWVFAGLPASLHRFAVEFLCFEFRGELVGVLVGSFVADGLNVIDGVGAGGDTF